MNNDNNENKDSNYRPIIEWINANEEAKSNFSFNFNISFTQEITEEEARRILLQYITNSAERVMLHDSLNILNHLQYVGIEESK